MLGASTGSVTGMLSKDFVVLIVISMVIGFPLSWIVMNAWLAGFAYRISIGADVFIIAGMAMTTLALVSISHQSLRAALTNPATSLLYPPLSYTWSACQPTEKT